MKRLRGLAARMKLLYEIITRTFLMPNQYYIIRLDGKAFHTYTQGFQKPFDNKLVISMDAAAKHLCKKIDGAKFAYVQSDEISILVTAFDRPMKNHWFKGAIQKITSVTASLATSEFNSEMMYQQHVELADETGHIQHVSLTRLREFKKANFDSRVFSIGMIPKKFNVNDKWVFLNPKDEVANYFVNRQKDCIRNSISMVAQNRFSQPQLHKKKQADMLEMLEKAGEPWDEYLPHLQRGRLIVREKVDGKSDWVSKAAPLITENRDEFMGMIPDYEFPTPTLWQRFVYFIKNYKNEK